MTSKAITRTAAILAGDKEGGSINTALALFAGFDDWMEEQQPGHKARIAAANAERERQRALQHAEVIARYGSQEAALAPCPHEQRLFEAARHLMGKEWRQFGGELHEVETLDGWNDAFEDPPQSVIDALSAAYPLPRTVTEAKAEYDYWQARDEELELAHDSFCGDTALSLVADARRAIVEKLFRYELPAESLAEVEMRVAVGVRESDQDPELMKMMSAILADIRRLNKQQPAGRSRRKAP